MLTVALADRLVALDTPPARVHAVCYEIEKIFLPFLEENLDMCSMECEKRGMKFTHEIREQDFLQSTACLLECSLFGSPPAEQFDLVIMNPPYKKIATASRERRLLRSFGLETVNLYTGFMGAAASLLGSDGELVAITPRSFCNGPYYRAFRRYFFERMTLKRLHLFEKRDVAFRDDEVLQETIITVAVRNAVKADVCITVSDAPESPTSACVSVHHDVVVSPDDRELFIRLPVDNEQESATDRLARFNHTLKQLGVAVSTGRVVDFRAKEYLLHEMADGSGPLIYPTHFDGWGIAWPAKNGKKPNAITLGAATKNLFLPPGHYVLTRRFSAKEEKRRLVAVIYNAKEVSALPVAFENHINYFHANGAGLDEYIAWGLAAYLNSQLVDTYFRTFNGHTQVNATDLRSLPYPSKEQLRSLGIYAKTHKPDARMIDEFLMHKMDES